MFTNKDKAKELAIYIAGCPDTKICIEDTPGFSPIKDTETSIATVKTFIYKNKSAQIRYNKWIIEGAELAAQMKLPGYEKHNKLVQGSAVRVFSKSFNRAFYYFKQDAQDIIDACEQNHLLTILQLTNNLQR